MNTSRKAMEWLTCFSNVNLMLRCLLFKKFKNEQDSLQSTTACFDSYNSLSFKKIDKANSKFDLKIKEALHIKGTVMQIEKAPINDRLRVSKVS